MVQLGYNSVYHCHHRWFLCSPDNRQWLYFLNFYRYSCHTQIGTKHPDHHSLRPNYVLYRRLSKPKRASRQPIPVVNRSHYPNHFSYLILNIHRTSHLARLYLISFHSSCGHG